MIKPIKFGYNEQTANSNSFQVLEKENDTNNIQERALREFNDLASKLKEKEIDVTIIEDTSKPHTPDSIFPNNWISFHENNTMVLYPMLAENRRRERRTDIITHFLKEYQTVIDLSQQEENSFFLEGTGSIVFDYENKIAYAAISPRTNKNLVYELCKQVNYTPIVFTALDSTNAAIYHTNVLMCVGTTFAVLCAESIPNQIEQHQI
ncbi:MAG: amidinotransferase, partial [Bacteroidia bacterium]|nr:amidinotransferase [Bacteroidia bacterium]